MFRSFLISAVAPCTEKNVWQSVNYKENYEVLII